MSDIGVSASAGTATRPAGWPAASAESASTSHTGTPAGMKAARSRDVTTAVGAESVRMWRNSRSR